mgnify:CR=1 FL=1
MDCLFFLHHITFLLKSQYLAFHRYHKGREVEFEVLD